MLASEIESLFIAFIAEQFPFAYEKASSAFLLSSSTALSSSGSRARQGMTRGFISEKQKLGLRVKPEDEKAVSEIDTMARENGIVDIGHSVLMALRETFGRSEFPNHETTPFISIKNRMTVADDDFFKSVEGFFARQAIVAGISKSEKLWMLRGMIMTRACDERLKRMFVSGEIKYEGQSFQGKGFRSLGQEAIYAAALRLEKNDIVAPLIRDLGVALARSNDDVSMALGAQAGKDGFMLGGKDLHYGNLSLGILPAAAPLAIATCTAVGMSFAMKLRQENRIAVSFIGDGGSSLGEWYEAVNLAAVRSLPMIFCVQNNQIALSTKTSDQSRARVFADKAIGFGIPGITLDGTDPEQIASAFAWASSLCRSGAGPILIELVSMRMCGHAHHDDMLYAGQEPQATQWAARDPIKNYSRKLVQQGLCTSADVVEFEKEAKTKCDDAVAEIIKRPWPEKEKAHAGVFFVPELPSPREGEGSRVSGEGHSDPTFLRPPLPQGERENQGSTYLEAISKSIQYLMKTNSNVYLMGEDVAPPYGNAFMMFRGVDKELTSRFINTPIAENGIVGACVGMALEGMRPIGEMQFNDFAACGFNQIVNNAAKFYYRTGIPVPMVLRMPYGGLRRAGPYHSQDTSPWFYRSFGLKIVAPSTPYDAFCLMKSAVLDDNPVLFYEHIALYRDPKLRQILPEIPEEMPIGSAALRMSGDDMSIISYGAYVHKALQCALELEARYGSKCDVLDLRSLCPLDMESIERTVRKTGKILLVGEDSKTGSILESISSKINESFFHCLDAPVKVLGALDSPVPYSPSLEDEYVMSYDRFLSAAVALAKF